MTAQLTAAGGQRPLWWQGVGSPGLLGYVLADLVAVAVLALVLPLTEPSSLDDVGDYLSLLVLVGIYAFVFSVPLALIGIPVVHLCCRRVRSQAVHVLAAGLVGAAVISIPVTVVSGDLTQAVSGIYLGLATAVGRAAVIPLAVARRQS